MHTKTFLLVSTLLCSFATAGDIHWTYEGKTGPEQWGSLSDEFALCDTGLEQSPIDIQAVKVSKKEGLPSHFKPEALEVFNDGHTLQVNIKGDSYSEIAGKKYKLLQYHFHTPSENKIGGKAYAMEVHFVHRADDGALAVIGVFMEAGGEPHAAVDAIWKAAPTKGGETNTSSVKVDASTFLPEDKTFFRFMGSLTTPPCTEGLTWNVYEQPIQISDGQWETFLKVVGENARPIQPMNHRKVTLQGK